MSLLSAPSFQSSQPGAFATGRDALGALAQHVLADPLPCPGTCSSHTQAERRSPQQPSNSSYPIRPLVDLSSFYCISAAWAPLRCGMRPGRVL